MSNWWNDPRIQGEDNEYGEYDYMLGYDYNHMPESTINWRWSWEPHYCTDCGRKAHLYREYENFFHTYDGYDSIWGSESAYSIIVLGAKYKIRRGIKMIRSIIKDCIDEIKITHKYVRKTEDYTLAKALTLDVKIIKNILKYCNI